jgi:zona occludens toxin
MITLKSGVPGSGKTLSMVAELLDLSKVKEGQSPRPVYTNITGLALPHIPLVDCTKWRECPPGSLIVIDEAFLCGFEAKAQQQSVPDYIRDLAVHRKDYSVDIVFIAQHPKLLHVALRRQIGKHQHYRRMFGWGRSVCYEWDQVQDNLAATKTAVMSQFSYPKAVFGAYKSAEIHTKPKFSKPWYFWLPFVLVPAAAWALPHAFTTLSSAMTGNGLPGQASSAAMGSPFSLVPGVPLSLPPAAPLPSLPALAASAPVAVVPPEVKRSGCFRIAERCKCLSADGEIVPTEQAMCFGLTGYGLGPAINIGPDTPNPALMATR